MTTLGTLPLIRNEATFFGLPPRRPRPVRGEARERSLGRLVRDIRRGLREAAAARPADAVPRLRNYPY